MTAPGDQVQLDAADAKAMRDDLPAAGLEITDRLLFTGKAALVARVGPVRWIAVNAARHDEKISALPWLQ